MSRTLAHLRERFADHNPILEDPAGRGCASVAMILREEADGDLSLLFIRRAHDEGDRWSGDIAFPGGRMSAQDANAQAAAERETYEEVGLQLAETDRVGRMDDLAGNRESILVSAFVYAVERRSELVPSHEVDSAFWLPLREIESPSRHLRRSFQYHDKEIFLPAIRVLDDEGSVLWGLSYRFLELLMTQARRPIPGMPWVDV